MNDQNPTSAVHQLWSSPPTGWQDHMAVTDVYVWLSRWDRQDDAPQASIDMLSEDELARSSRFRYERHRRTYLYTKALVRTILSACLRASPKQLVFENGPEGKPQISPAWSRCAGRTLHFNVSHTEGAMLLAVAWDVEVGVDIEYARPIPEARRIAEQFLSEQEVHTFRARPREDFARDFLACWVQKESCVKALGSGLFIPLHEFDVPISSLHDDEWVAITSHVSADTCSLRTLELGSHFVGAVAVQGATLPLRKLMCWTWPTE